MSKTVDASRNSGTPISDGGGTTGFAAGDFYTPPPDDFARRESARPVQAADLGSFAAEVDVIVVGGGGSGFATALFSAWRGNEVLLLEKAADVGGTTRKSAFGFWVANNKALQRAGLEDRRDECLQFMAKMSRPQRFDPNSPTYGLSEWDFDLIQAIYDSGAEAVELLHEKGALRHRPAEGMVEYFTEVPENKLPAGRVLFPDVDDFAQGGEAGFSMLVPAADEAGVQIVRGCRVQRLVLDGEEVVGVQGTGSDGSAPTYFARRGVVFASGGFVHDDELRENSLHVPAFAGCGVHSNEGDLVRIAGALGVPMRNMSNAWMAPIPFEPVAKRDPRVMAMAGIQGDSMVLVNREGQRVVNEKLPYNELSRAFFYRDPITAEYPNLVMFQIWDSRAQEHSAGNYLTTIVSNDDGVIKGQTLEELGGAIDARLAQYESATGCLRLADGFTAGLRETIERFNRGASEGVDPDFHRGETPIQLVFNGNVKDEGERRNPTVWPISETGPYYAVMICACAMDTKGGPKVNADSQMVDDLDQPIPGLYGVGNCVASVSGNTYWGPGATIGPMMAFAYRAAAAIDREPRRSGVRAAVAT
ncbi:FAD-dependent oxidoreductase [Rhodococcus sp. WS4]|nr:FAD-dependent oxidoreductase [Rhodococcus sp. WS4]